jgi:hypothetical protein
MRLSQQTSDALPAVDDTAGILAPAKEPKVADAVILDIEQRYQGDLFRSGLFRRQFFSQHAFESIPAIHDRAFALVPAGKLQIANLIVLDAEQGYQGDFLFLALGFGLLQQGNRIAAFDEALPGKTDNFVEIVIPQAPWNTADHNVSNPLLVL